MEHGDALSPSQALNVLDQIAARSAMNRKDTQLAIRAVSVLNALINSQPVAEVKEPVKLNKGEPKHA